MSAQTPLPPIPPPNQDPASPYPPPPKRQCLHPSPSSESISQKDSNLIHIENQRRELTKSIIENLGRDELEELLLEAALGHEEVMRSVVRVNGSSHGKGLSEDVCQDGSAMKRRSGRGEGCGDEGGKGGEGEDEGRDVGEERDGRGLGMDGLRGVDGGGPMQFHHVTKRQFEVRMVRIREKGFEAEEVNWGAG